MRNGVLCWSAALTTTYFLFLLNCGVNKDYVTKNKLWSHCHRNIADTGQSFENESRVCFAHPRTILDPCETDQGTHVGQLRDIPITVSMLSKRQKNKRKSMLSKCSHHFICFVKVGCIPSSANSLAAWWYLRRLAHVLEFLKAFIFKLFQTSVYGQNYI